MADAPPPAEGNANQAPAVTADRSWERPWSLEEMRKGANNWSLAGDAGLLLYLQQFSQKLISRTHEIEKEVENLVHDSKMTSVRVNNVFNEFMMLANTQFVENRVYDEDVHNEAAVQEEKKAETQEKTREQREAELIPKVSEAIRLGVEVIEKAFEKLDTNIDNSDSEEDESYRVDPILEAKDPYLDRTLPYLIGTPNFMQDDNVGLKDVSDTESDAGSISESEAEDEDGEQKKNQGSEYSYSETESESDTEKPQKQEKKQMFPQGSDESDSDGDLFGEKKPRAEESDSEGTEDSEEEEENTKPQPPAGAPLDFASELARKLGGPAPKAPSPVPADEDEEEEKPKKKEKKKGKKEKKKKEKDNEDDLFGSGGKQSDEDDDLFGGGTFGGKKSGDLFGDSDEGDLFGDSSKKTKEEEKKESSEEEEEEVKPVEKKPRARTSSGKKVPVGGVSVFGLPQEKTKPGGGGVGGGLFDEEEDEDDMFGGSTAAAKPKQETKEKPEEKPAAGGGSSGGGGLFADDEDEDDLFGEAPKKQEKQEPPAKKHPAGSVPMFGPPGAGNPLAQALKSKLQRKDSDEENDDWSGGEKSRTESIKSNQSGASKKSAQMSSTQSKDSLFTGDPDDSLAASKPKANSFSKNAKLTSGLFDDDDEDDLFGSVAKPPPSKPATQKIEPEKPKKSDLFMDDEDEDDLFGAGGPPAAKPKETGPKKPVGGVSLFPSGIDPFSKKKTDEEKNIEPPKKAEPPKEEPPKKVEPPKKEEPTRRPPAKSISLFDEDDEEEDLFGSGSAPKPPAQKQTPPAAGKKSIFDDDGGDMFGGDDSGDIFSKPPAQTMPTPKPAEPVTKVTKPPATKKAPALFGDDDEEDDLFGSGPTKKPETSIDILGATTTESTDTVEKIEDKPVEEKKKKPFGGVSMFGPGGPDLLGISRKSSGKTIETVEEVVVKKPEARKPAVDPLLGEDKDDLFARPVKKQDIDQPDGIQQEVKKPEPVKQDVKKPEPVKQEVEKPKQSKGPLDEDEDDDLFGGGKTETNKPPESPTEVKPKKPVGGVSMFGGVDPFSAIKKSSEPKAKTPDLPSPDDDLFSGNNEKPKPSQESGSKKETESPAPKGKIGKLQASLNFNPAAMLPGAAPPVKEPEPIKIGFDAPAEANTLQSVNKDRAKIQSKRRPPSRNARKAAAGLLTPTSPTDEFFNSTASPITSPSKSSPSSEIPDFDLDPSRVPPPLSNSPERVPSPGITEQRVDLFGNDDLFGEDLPKPGAKSVIGQRKDTNSEKSSPDDLFQANNLGFKKSKTENLDDLFTSTQTNSSSTKSKPPVINDDDDDLFSAVPKSTKADKSKSSKLVNDDDLLNSVPKKTEQTKPPVTDDDDDIFAVKKTKSKPNPSPIIEDDDDLFSSAALNKPKKKKDDSGPVKTENKTEPVTKADGDNQGKDFSKTEESKPKAVDDDDIFATATTTTEKKKPKKAMTKDEDIFADNTDIFNDIPAAKPKEKKTKKKTTTAPKKTIFKDDIDDIFADTSAAAGKPKEKKKKTTKDKPEKNGTTDVVDDPLMS